MKHFGIGMVAFVLLMFVFGAATATLDVIGRTYGEPTTNQSEFNRGWEAKKKAYEEAWERVGSVPTAYEQMRENILDEQRRDAGFMKRVED